MCVRARRSSYSGKVSGCEMFGCVSESRIDLIFPSWKKPFAPGDVSSGAIGNWYSLSRLTNWSAFEREPLILYTWLILTWHVDGDSQPSCSRRDDAIFLELFGTQFLAFSTSSRGWRRAEREIGPRRNFSGLREAGNMSSNRQLIVTRRK